jgi:hypothetical protein
MPFAVGSPATAVGVVPGGVAERASVAGSVKAATACSNGFETGKAAR